MRPARLIALAVLVLVAIGCGDDAPPASAPPTTASTSSTSPRSSTSSTSSTSVPEVVEVRTEEYGRAEVGAPEPGPAPLLLDLYLPPETPGAARPVVVVIHGGGFTQQSREDPGIVRIARALAERGVVAASIDYRLIPQEPVASGRVGPLVEALADNPLFDAMATAVDDTLTAIDWLADHAGDLGIDPDRLGLVGSSAGAITADHVAYALDDHGIDGPAVTVVGSLWGGLFVPPPDGGPVTATQLGPTEAALYAVHGDADERVPVALSDALAAEAEAEGVAVEYHRIPGGAHGYEPSRFFTEELDDGATPFDRLLTFVTGALA